jgi:hypothetical protein
LQGFSHLGSPKSLTALELHCCPHQPRSRFWSDHGEHNLEPVRVRLQSKGAKRQTQAKEKADRGSIVHQSAEQFSQPSLLEGDHPPGEFIWVLRWSTRAARTWTRRRPQVDFGRLETHINMHGSRVLLSEHKTSVRYSDADETNAESHETAVNVTTRLV